MPSGAEMTGKRRYVVQVPGHVRQSAGFSLEDIVAGLPGDQLIRAGSAGTRVLELSDAELTVLGHGYPGLLVEADQELELLGSMPALGFKIEGARGEDLGFAILDAETQKPISDVTVFVQGEHAT